MELNGNTQLMRFFKWLAIVVSLGIAFAANALGQRQMEKLDRGLVGINQGEDIGVFLSWRLLGTEPQELGFNVYRQTGSADPVANANRLHCGRCFTSGPRW